MDSRCLQFIRHPKYQTYFNCQMYIKISFTCVYVLKKPKIKGCKFWVFPINKTNVSLKFTNKLIPFVNS